MGEKTAKVTPTAMEREWFSWDGWDGDQEYMQFYNVTLKKQVGKHAAGTRFSSAGICFKKGVIEFYDDTNDIVTRCRISYAIGEELPVV